MFYSLYSAFEAPHGCYQMDLNHVFNLAFGFQGSPLGIWLSRLSTWHLAFKALHLAFGFRGSTPLCHQMSLYLLDCTYLSPL
jgi:hypothetical protein